MCTLLEHGRYSGKANQPDISQTEEYFQEHFNLQVCPFCCHIGNWKHPEPSEGGGK